MPRAKPPHRPAARHFDQGAAHRGRPAARAPRRAALTLLALVGACAKSAPVEAPASAPGAVGQAGGAGLRAGGPPLVGAPAAGRPLLDPIDLPPEGEGDRLRVSPAGRLGDRRWPVAFHPLISAGKDSG
ncbi:MAG: hypothetical protein RL071_3610, partial [Pseudomonadota bacterium]